MSKIINPAYYKSLPKYACFLKDHTVYSSVNGKVEYENSEDAWESAQALFRNVYEIQEGVIESCWRSGETISVYFDAGEQHFVLKIEDIDGAFTQEHLSNLYIFRPEKTWYVQGCTFKILGVEELVAV